MNSTARQRFAQMMQQEQASQAQADMLSQMRGPRPVAPATSSMPQGQASRMMGAVRMAEGGAVGPLPSLQELSNPNYQYQDPSFGASAPFTQLNPIVPMFNLESPAFGGMEQSTYDFTAPSVQGGQFTQPARQAPAMPEFTSAYRPVDATTLPGGGANIPDVPLFPGQDALQQTQPTQPVVTQPTQPVVTQPTQPVVTQPTAPAQTTGAIPGVITPEERIRREQNAAELTRQQAEEDVRVQAGIQAEARRQEALAEQQRQDSIDAEAARLEQEEADRQNALRIAQETAARQQAEADQQVQSQAARRELAQAAADDAEQAERERQARAVANNRNNSLVNLFSGGIRSTLGGSGLPVYNPNEMVSVTRLVDGGQGGQYVEQVPRSQYDIEQARAKAYQSAFEA